MNNKNIFFKTLLCITLLCCTTAFLPAQEEINPQEQARFDSVMTVLSDNKLSLDEKYDLLAVELDIHSIDYNIAFLKKMVQLSKVAGNNEKTITLYSNILLYYSIKSDFATGQLYLDSALMYADKVNDLSLGKLYYAAGSFYGQQSDFTRAHEHYYKAIEYFDKVGGLEYMKVTILLNIGAAYVFQQDTMNIRMILEEIRPLSIELNDPVSFIETYMLAASYYRTLYEFDKEELHYKDSTISYYKKIIDTYNSIDKPLDSYGYTVSKIYPFLASMLLKSPDVNLGEVKNYLEAGKKIALPGDFEFFCYYHETYAGYYLKTRDYDRALDEAEKALELVKQTGNDEYHKIYSNLYGTFADIYDAKGDCQSALKYKNIQMDYQAKIFDEKQHATIQDMRTKYDVEKKEQSIQQLTERNEYQNKIRYLYIGLIALVLILLFFILIWFRNKRKADAALLNLAQLRQQEAELKTALETAKLEEKNLEYQSLLNETQQRQLKSYLEGLETERARLARDLHDDVSNELVSINMKVEQNDLDKKALQESLHALHSQIRNISHALMPPVFKYASLPDILEDYIRQQQRNRKENIRLDIDLDYNWDMLPANVALDVYRIVQEAVSNALKHAEAKNITIKLSRQEGKLQLLVKDDGKGFDTQNTTKGIGLKTIRERTESLEGDLEIISDEKGSVIFANIPLVAQNQ